MNRVLFTAFMLSAVAAHAQVKDGMVGINHPTHHGSRNG